MTKNIFAISLLFAATACSVGSRPAPSVYNISPEVSIGKTACKSSASIEIANPTTAPGLEGRRIAVINDSNKMDYYSGIRWTAPINDMVQQVLIESFEKSGAFKTVSTDVDSVNADYTLITDLRDFQVTSATAPTVKARAVAKLIKSDSRNIVASIPVEKEITPTENKTQAIVDAFNKATAELAVEIVNSSKKKIAGCEK